MKRSILSIVTLLFVFSIYAKDIQELVVTTTPPMSCQNCENKIKGNLRFEKGVKKIETNLSEQRVTIEYDAEKTDPEKIEKAFQQIGYKVEVIDPQTPACANASSSQGHCSNGGSSSQGHCSNGGSCSHNKEK